MLGDKDSAAAPTTEFPYNVEEKIGEGAMGVVYRAHEPALNRQVAIKMMSKALLAKLGEKEADDIRKRFIQEARAAAALSHPGVTTIFRVGEYQDQPFIAMEWLDGQDLESILERQPRHPIPEVMRWGIELLEALDAAHQRNIVHRDIKPANVMLLKDGRLKVTDFGIAHVSDAKLVQTQAGAVVGTPQYASPEQITGGDIDGRADIFSTGIVLYQALTGELPFSGRSFFELAQQVITAQPSAPRMLNPNISPEFEAIILKALQKSPGARFNTARDMANALRALGRVNSSTAISALPLYQGSATPPPSGLALTAVLQVPVFESLDPPLDTALAEVFQQWPRQDVDPQPLEALLERLLEKPLHAKPFSGVVQVEHAYILLNNGLIIAAFDPYTRLRGDELIDQLPPHSAATLFTCPESLPQSAMGLFATMVNPRRTRHADLDAAIMNMGALAFKLEREEFSGVIRMEQHGGAFCALLMCNGLPAAALASKRWGNVPTHLSWPEWIAQPDTLTSIDDPSIQVGNFCYRRALNDYVLNVSFVEPDVDAPAQDTFTAQSSLWLSGVGSSTSSSTQSLPEKMRILRPKLTVDPNDPRQTLDPVMANDPMIGFVHWMLFGLPVFLKERQRASGWKYLVGWVPDIARVHLHHHLTRPKSSERDFFDLVTEDANGKVLHLGHRVPVGTPQRFKDFVDRVIAAKSARIKTGDIGGAVFIAKRFEGDMLTAYREAIHAGEKSGAKWLFGLQKSLTGYEGFVRMGARRGFHLLLVLETDRGFQPVLPDESEL